MLPCCTGQPFEQNRPDPLMLEVISNDKRHLGIGRPGNSVVAADGDQPIIMLSHQSQAVDIVDMGELLRLS